MFIVFVNEVDFLTYISNGVPVLSLSASIRSDVWIRRSMNSSSGRIDLKILLRSSTSCPYKFSALTTYSGDTSVPSRVLSIGSLLRTCSL
jgi:hypothetical protein